MSAQRKVGQALREPATLFSFNAKYQIAADADMDSVLDDALCWLEPAQAIVASLANGLEDEGGDMAANPNECARMLYGVWHLLKMVNGALLAHQLASVKQQARAK